MTYSNAEIVIEANFIGPFQSYTLYYSDFRHQYQFKWDRPSNDTDRMLNQRWSKKFKWYDSVREAMMEASSKKWEIHPFLHFRVNNVIQNTDKILNFI